MPSSSLSTAHPSVSREVADSFFHAIERNSLHGARAAAKLLRQHPQLATVRHEGLTGLMMATQRRNATLVQALLSRSDLTAVSQTATAEEFIDPPVGFVGFTALMLAASEGWTQGVELLLPMSTPSQLNAAQCNALMEAAARGHALCVQALLDHTPLDQQSENGCDALILAASAPEREQATHCVRLLLQRCSPETQDWMGCTALWHAVKMATVNDPTGFGLERVRLLAAHSDPLWLAADGRSPLELARSRGHRALIEVLEHTPDRPSFAHKRHQTELFRELMMAVQDQNCTRLAQVLQIDPPLALVHDGAMGQQQTALMRAAHLGALSCLEALLPLSDPKAVNHRGQTALMLAARAGHLSCVQRLLPVSDVRQLTVHGENALFYALNHNHPDCALCLIPDSDLHAQFQGASLSAPEESLQTPLSLAIFHGQWTLVEALVAGGGTPSGEAMHDLFRQAVWIAHTQNQFRTRDQEPRWRCVDPLVPFVPRSMAQHLLAQVDRRFLPRFCALVERDHLEIALDNPLSPSGTAAPSTAEPTESPSVPLSTVSLDPPRRSMRL